MFKKKNKPAANKAKRRKRGKGLRKIIKDSRTPKVLGLISTLISVFMFIAFLSYLFTWKEDQSTVFKFSWNLVFGTKVSVQNSLGRLGAMMGHQFFYRWVGLMAFIYPLVLFTGGLNLLMRKHIFPFSKIFKYSLVTSFILPVAFAYFFYNRPFPFGGSYGMYVNDWMVAFIGNIGTGIFLSFVLLLYLVIAFNLEFKIGMGFKKSPAEDEPEEALSKDIGIREDLEYGKQEVHIEKESHDNPDLEVNLPDEQEVHNSEHSENDNDDIQLDIAEVKEESSIERGKVHTNYDPTLDLPNYKYPDLELLEDYGQSQIRIDKTELEQNKDQIIETLDNYKISISKIKATIGPTVTLYEIIPAKGIRISKIKNLEDDIALSLSALGIRIIAPMPGKGTIGIEVPNAKKEIVPIRGLLASEKFRQSDMELPIVLGKNIANENYIADLAKMPHLLLAGATGQGKSVGINSVIISLLYKKHPSQLKFVLIDPKKVELALYKRLEKHFLAQLPGSDDPIITDTKKVVHTLKALSIEMDQRYDLMKEARVRNIKEYNTKFIKRKLNPEKGHRFMPYIVLIVDEFADLMMTAGKEIEIPVTRLAQLARAIGIHLIIATQRPSVNIITGTIKANFPARIAYKVTSKVDSRTIIDMGGADQLIGRGDMLLSVGGHLTRLQCAFVDTHEVEKVTEFIGDQQGYAESFMLPEYIDENDESARNFDTDDRDELFEDAARLVVLHQSGSTSLIQRRMKLGYNRAGRIMDQLEAVGIVGPSEGSKARQVLFPDEYQLEQFLNSLD